MLSGLGFELIVLILLALYVGKKLSGVIDFKGMESAVLIFFAMGIWIYRVVITLNKLEKQKEILKNKDDLH